MSVRVSHAKCVRALAWRGGLRVAVWKNVLMRLLLLPRGRARQVPEVPESPVYFRVDTMTQSVSSQYSSVVTCLILSKCGAFITYST